MTAPSPPGPVLVFGAGAVGCWIGGCLRAAGVPITFVGRPRVLQALRTHGLTLTDLDGGRRHIPAGDLDPAESVPAGIRPALVLLCVKSGATAAAARTLAAAVPAGTVVVSMQNGISNAAIAQAHALPLTVRAGVVGFNVAELAPGHVHRGTSGELAAQDAAALQAWTAVFAAAGLPLTLHTDLAPLQWGKLLLNLNNAVNALSGLPLREQLLQRDYRLCVAALMAEALAAMRAAGITPQRLAPLPPRWLPAVLRLPTPLFRVVAARMLRIDAKARSSMADDLAADRVTEIDALNGEVLRLAQAHGVAAPVTQRSIDLVRTWPQRRQPMSGPALRAALGV